MSTSKTPEWAVLLEVDDSEDTKVQIDFDRHWDTHELTTDIALDHVIQFGKHKGKPIRDIIRSQSGRSYLRWCLDNFDGMSNYTRQPVTVVMEALQKFS